MPSPAPDDASSRAPLDERVVRILAERAGTFAFNGLRRELRAHPESLARALRRLERAGTVGRVDGGYQLLNPPNRPGRAPTTKVVATVELLGGIDPEQLHGALAGRWFGRLRWVGALDREDGPWLVWSVEGTRSHVLLGARAGRLTIALDGAASEEEESKAESAAAALLRRAVGFTAPVSRTGTRGFAADDAWPSTPIGPEN